MVRNPKIAMREEAAPPSRAAVTGTHDERAPQARRLRPAALPTAGCRHGYSLLELVLAIGIFSIGVIGAMELFGLCLRSSAASSDYTQAVFLAQGLIEGQVADPVYVEDSDSGDFGTDHPKHSWTLDVEETKTEGLYKLTATVTWDEAGVSKSYTLTTLASERS